MAEAKAPKLQVSYDDATGVMTFNFGAAGSLAVKPEDYPPAVQRFWMLFGLKTAGRNAGIGSTEDGSVGTPEQMCARTKAKFDRWMAGELGRVASGEEKPAAPLLILEAASIYKAMAACFKATGDVEGWEAYDRPEPESLRTEIEALEDFVTNPEVVEAAKKAAAEKNEDVEAAAKKATITRLDQLKANKLFKLAYGEAEEARRAAKKAALKAALKAEAAAM